MAGLSSAALMMFFQDNAVATQTNDVHWIKIFVGIAAVGFLIQCLAIAGAVVFALAMLKKVAAITETVEKKIMPLVAKTQVIVDDLTPKIRAVSENVEQISYTVRAKADEIADTVTEIKKTVLQVNQTVQQYNVTAQEANLRTRGQIARVDGMVTDALNTTHEVSHNIQEGIKRPIRKAAEMVQGWKATIEGFAAKAPFLNRQPKGPQSPYDF